jgi:hypothetical protein
MGGGIRMRDVVLAGVLVGMGVLLAKLLPDIRRYVKISRM